MIRYGTVCSGIGAPELAVKDMDWQCSFMSEIEAFPREVLRERFPDHPLHGDFTTIQEKDYGSVDVLIGGTPCQDFSVAGKRLGLDAPRGNLALEYLALARRLNSRWIVWENVPGMLSSWSDDEVIDPSESALTQRQRNDFDTFLAFVGECGYQCAWRVLDGQYFGVPQRRRRIILVGYIGDWRPAAAVLFERESLRGDITPRRETGEGVAHALAARSAMRHREDGDTYIPEIAWALQERDHKGADSDTKQGHLIPVAFNWQGGGKQTSLGYEPESGIAGSLHAHQTPAVASEMRVRRLTPTECERLMDYPDGWTAITQKNGKVAADGPRYKSLGNSMIVGKMRWVLSRVDAVEAILKENQFWKDAASGK